MTQKNPNPTDSTGWFDKKENVRKVFNWLLGACALLVVIDIIFWITGFDKHPYLNWQKWPGFQAVYGFVSCSVLVLVAKYVLRPMVKRDEDYYEKDLKGGENDA